MPLISSNTADKIIVDRRKPHRNSDVARAVRKTRDRLAQQPGSLNFDRELLKLHARAMISSAIAIPVLVLVIAVAGLASGMNREIVIWALVTLAGYAGLAIVARRLERSEAADFDVRKTRRNFLIAHFASGLGWAYFAWLGCGECQVDQFQVVKAVVLLLAIAATALMASSLRGALASTFVLPVAVYAILGSRVWTPIEMLMLGLLVVSLPFFSYVASLMNRSSLMLLSFRTEKDALIAELETAKVDVGGGTAARRRGQSRQIALSRHHEP